MAINEWGETVDDDDLDKDNDSDSNSADLENIKNVKGAFAKILRGENKSEKIKPQMTAPSAQNANDLSPDVKDFVITILEKAQIKGSFTKSGKLTLEYKVDNLAALRINRVLAEYGLSTSKLNAEKIVQLMKDNQAQQEFIKRVTAALAGRSLDEDDASTPTSILVDNASKAAAPPPPPPVSAIPKAGSGKLQRAVPPPSDNANSIANILRKRREGIAGDDDSDWDEDNEKKDKPVKSTSKATDPVQSKADKAAAIAALTQLHTKGSDTRSMKVELKESQKELKKSIKIATKQGDDEEVERQKAELQKVKERQVRLQNEADHLAHQEHDRKILGATVRNDAERIKKNIKSHLKELRDIVGRYKNAPSDASLEEKGNSLISEIEGLRSQLEQKFLLLTSPASNKSEIAEKIKDDLHLDKLQVTIAEGLSAAKQQIKTVKEDNERALSAEQERQEQARAARQEAELKRIEDEKQRLLQEEKRQRAHKEAKDKTEQEEKARAEELKLVKAQEDALKAQKKDLEKQAKALQKVDFGSAKEDPASAELRRLSGEHSRLEDERERLKKEDTARESEKASHQRDQLKLETKTQELARAEQDRARAAQQRGLEAERNKTSENTVSKPIKDNLLTSNRAAKIQKAREEQDKDFADKSEIRRKDRMMGYLTDFGNDKASIELVLSNRYQEKRTERKLKGLFQSIHLKTGGRVSSHKRNKQISELATVIQNLQKETGLSADEMNNIMRGALQTIMDNIKETEKRNLFTSRLFTECEELQKHLPHIKAPLDATASKELYARYTQGGAQAVKGSENDSNRQNRL